MPIYPSYCPDMLAYNSYFYHFKRVVKVVKIASGISFTRIYHRNFGKSGKSGKKRMRKIAKKNFIEKLIISHFPSDFGETEKYQE